MRSSKRVKYAHNTFGFIQNNIWNSRCLSVSVLMRNRASRRLWGTYEHGWIWCADNVMSESLWKWLENDNAELFLEFSPNVLSEVHLAYLALATYSKNILHRASGLEIVLKYVSGRFGIPLNISMFIRDQGETKSHKWITRDGPIFGSFTAKKAVGAVVDINWENLTMSNMKSMIGKELLSQQLQQSRHRKVLRLGHPIQWYNSQSSIQAVIGGVCLILSYIYALKLDTGAFHFLWALVFSNLLKEEVAVWTFPRRFIGVVRNDVAVGTVELITHTLMITTVGLVEALYNLKVHGKERYTEIVSLFWSAVLFTTLLSHISPFFVNVRNVLSKRPEEIVQLARTDLQLCNDLVLDAGAKLGLRCGGEHLVSGVAIVNEEVASDVGDKWKESLGHTEMQAGTTRLGSTVCVG